MALIAAKLGSKEKALASAKKGSEDSFIVYLKADQTLRVRYLSEPEEWVKYTEHYNSKIGYFVCDDELCLGCNEGLKKSRRYLTPVIFVDENRIGVLKLPQQAYGLLMKKYERYGTMTDRDYEVSRSGGSQFDTTYEIEPMEKMRINLSRFKTPSPHKTWYEYTWSFIIAMANAAKSAMGDDDDEDDEEDSKPPITKRRASSVKTKATPTKAKSTLIRRR